MFVNELLEDATCEPLDDIKRRATEAAAAAFSDIFKCIHTSAAALGWDGFVELVEIDDGDWTYSSEEKIALKEENEDRECSVAQ